jgi:alkylation response protein AidB-like acyl-CoA dehydrogenase
MSNLNNSSLTNAAGARSLEAAMALAPQVRDAGAEIEREGKLTRPLVDAFLDAGLFHLMVPEDLGGTQADPVSAAKVVEEVAKADGSAGWCIMIAAQCAAFAGFMPADEVRTIWGNGGIVAGTARPIGRAVATDGGYTVSGRWPIASGSSHATWFAAECLVYDGEENRRDANGNEVSRVVFVPAGDVTVHPTWDTLGLRGTASNDFSIEPVFVPESRGFQMLVSEPQHSWPVYKAAALIFMNHGSHALGIARGAVDAAIEIASSKIGWGGVPLRNLATMQQTIGEAQAQVEAASSYLYTSAEDLWQSVLDGRDEPKLRARLRLASSHAATASVNAVDLVHGALATSAIYTKSPLDRQFRDIHTAAAHVMIGPLTYQAAGRTLMGMEAAFPFF